MPLSLDLESRNIRAIKPNNMMSKFPQIMRFAVWALLPGALTLACVTTASSQQPSKGTVLTLEQSISLALENNRSVQDAKLEAGKSSDRLAALRTHRLPSMQINSLISQPLTKFEFTFEKGLFGTFPATGPIPPTDTTITSPEKPTLLLVGSVSQPLTQLYKLNLNIKQAEAAEEISQAELRAKQQTAVRDVKQAYYSMLQTQSAADEAREAIRFYTELDRVTTEYVTLQVALKPDLLEVQTRLAKAEYDQLTLENQLATQKEQFNNLLGRPAMTNFEISPVPEAIDFLMRESDLQSARERALAHRSELIEARLKVRQAELDRRAKKAEYIPDISFGLNYLSPFNYSEFLPKNILHLGFLVQWNVFDWGRKKYEMGERSKTIDQASNGLREAENLVLIDVNAKYRKLQETTQLMRVARLTQETARANVQIATNRYRVEAAMLKDVLEAQTSLADANYQYQKALLGFWTAKAEFEKAIGEDK